MGFTSCCNAVTFIPLIQIGQPYPSNFDLTQRFQSITPSGPHSNIYLDSLWCKCNLIVRRHVLSKSYVAKTVADDVTCSIENPYAVLSLWAIQSCFMVVACSVNPLTTYPSAVMHVELITHPKFNCISCFLWLPYTNSVFINDWRMKCHARPSWETHPSLLLLI